MEVTDSEAELDAEDSSLKEQPVSAVAAASTAARMILDFFMLMCSFLSGTRGMGALKKPSSKGKGHDKPDVAMRRQKSVRPIPRDPGYNPCTFRRQVSWLEDHRRKPPSRFPSG